MMEDLFNVDLDLNLDLGVDNSNNLDFLPEDLFNFIGEDLKEIAENDAIPNIESLINFEEDDQLVDDEIQWDFDLDTTDFLFENVQQQQQQVKPDNQANSESSFNSNYNLTKSISRQQKNKQTKQSQQQIFVEDIASPTSTINSINSSPNSPVAGYATEGNSNDSTDFLDMFSTYYSLDSNNNLVSHPISTLSVDELSKLTTTINQQSYSSFHQSEHTFDLSNNFGGFVNVQSALNLVNGASLQPQSDFKKPSNKLTTVNSKTKKKSKGTSLLANKPKSYKTIKKEMLQKKSLLNNRSQLQMTNRLKINQTQLETSVEIITTTLTPQQQLNQFRSSYAQDHDYCFGAPQFINSSCSYDPSTEIKLD